MVKYLCALTIFCSCSIYGTHINTLVRHPALKPIYRIITNNIHKNLYRCTTIQPHNYRTYTKKSFIVPESLTKGDEKFEITSLKKENKKNKLSFIKEGYNFLRLQYNYKILCEPQKNSDTESLKIIYLSLSSPLPENHPLYKNAEILNGFDHLELSQYAEKISSNLKFKISSTIAFSQHKGYFGDSDDRWLESLKSSDANIKRHFYTLIHDINQNEYADINIGFTELIVLPNHSYDIISGLKTILTLEKSQLSL